ncbi:MAG TPA: multifunctional oxoglutarate decarboxylase/oxoglutarate dehydrogenase thiamine pyrophosphate-binding subunit/dihydrolipoyllysine-residue succinyltransferase subunit [Rhodothermales bacterium]|nr:multifunctional oxoglutarate decarboxylase/oxoglutarate dehydrogenase thiamine pyrophosphate-binding subunit/dihydrolipoyllysine-residue succinyltransferase subunit [Rhodothermales bacterium]
MDNLGYNTGYIEELYSQYLQNPQSVSGVWQEFFKDYRPEAATQASAQSRAAYETAVATQEQKKEQTPQVLPPPAPKQTGRSINYPPVPPQSETVWLKGAPARLATNMEDSLSVPTATSFFTVPVKLMAENRRLVNEFQRTRGGAKISFTHIIAFAMVQALKKYPNLYTAYRFEGEKPWHVKPGGINLGIAVSTTNKDGSSALVVPNIKNANEKNFAAFVGSFDDLTKRARLGKLTPEDFAGTTASLTNPGMIGTFASVPRLMVGQGLIVATGAITYPPEYLALPPDELSRMGISQVMGLTSTYDHRIIQGAESGAFLAYIGKLLLGGEQFYHQIFRDLGLAQPPFSIAMDSTPGIGRGTYNSEQELIRKQGRVIQLIRAYRWRGHRLADINPLGYDPPYIPDLDQAEYGLSIWDLDRAFFSDGLGGKDEMLLRDILDTLWETYTRKVGAEFMHIADPVEKKWLQDRIESHRMQDPLSNAQKVRILDRLNAAEALENFIHTKYIGHKRFSLEGGETMIPILDRILCDAADQEVKEVVIGMPHRGRLNVLTNILNKPYERLFREFSGMIDPDTMHGSGDVKYHLGTSGTFVAPTGSEVNVRLCANPSHLEAVGPVVEGMSRAIQEMYWVEEHNSNVNFDRVLPIIIHGDAAFAGQGVVAETLQMSQLTGYRTGGTIHIIVNNQIGFTTNPEDARSSQYASDMALMIQAPVLRVNGDDPEACVRAARLAMDYRQVFNKDIVIDMVCYRKYGHNEGDDPSYTQPLMYEQIKRKRSVRNLYLELLVRRGDLTIEQAEAAMNAFQATLHSAFDRTKELAASDEKPKAKPKYQFRYPTAIGRDKVDLVVKALSEWPSDFNVHPKLKNQFLKREKMYRENGSIDWALGEAIAFGSLLLEGHKVRISGEDSQRGTFSHRHSVLHDMANKGVYVPLNHLAEEQAPYAAFDSFLSEYAVLGFDYGFSVADPSALTIWEAQFGDFFNGAQIIFDQFIAAAEAKWNQHSGLVCLLPHGYEGQGPEHSSARLERFLQACAEENIQVCNFSTPANYFHALRRQAKMEVKKPLIVMSPKSLLRHKHVVSKPEDFTEGEFQPLIPAISDPARIERLVFCSGKVYFDLLERIESEGGTLQGASVALARLEQFYPFPEEDVLAEIKRYSRAKDILWVQEEPENMGAWRFVQPYLNALIAKGNKKAKAVRYVGRNASASTAAGLAQVHAREQNEILTGTLAF